jgi:hypothetical protein
MTNRKTCEYYFGCDEYADYSVNTVGDEHTNYLCAAHTKEILNDQLAHNCPYYSIHIEIKTLNQKKAVD